MRGLIDSTLREGGQTVGVSFSLAQQCTIVDGLGRVGIEEIELGVAGRQAGHLPDLFRYCRRSGYRGRLALWCRCRPEDVVLAATLGPDVLSLSIPVSDLHLSRKLGRDRAWALAAAGQAVSLALDLRVPEVSLGLEDATRAALDFLEEIVRIAVEAGARRVRLADTVGVASPQEIAALVGRLRQCASVTIGIHAHNDFGMATANSLAALEAGADWADVTVLGLGERAGNARLEELAGFLAVRRHHPYRLAELATLCRSVAEAAGRPIGPHHPLVGEEIFACETGLHLQGLHREPATYEPYEPSRVGRVRKMLFGAKIGRQALMDLFDTCGKRYDPGKLSIMASRIRETARTLGRPLSAREALDLDSG